MAYEFLKKLFGTPKDGEAPRATTCAELEAAIDAEQVCQYVLRKFFRETLIFSCVLRLLMVLYFIKEGCMMSLSSVLKSKRKELGLTLNDIAEQMGVSEATVQRWESGNIKSLRHGRISKLAAILHVNPSALMGWDEETATPSIPTDAIPYNPQRNTLADERLARITANYHQLNDEGQDKLVDYSDDLVSTCRYSLKNSEHQALEKQA